MAEEESDVEGDEEIYESEEGENLSDFVYSEGEEEKEEIEDIEVLKIITINSLIPYILNLFIGYGCKEKEKECSQIKTTY